MTIKNSLNRNILYLVLVQGSIYILPLVTFPYLVRVLGPESFGFLGFCQASMQYLVLLTDYGFNWSATQQVAKMQENRTELTRIFSAVICSKIFLAIISFAILLLACFLIPKYRELWIILLSLTPLVLGNVFYPVWFFQGLEKMKWVSICSISSRLFSIPLTFLFVHSSEDVWIAALIFGSVNLMAGLLGFYLIFKYNLIDRFVFNITDIKESLSRGWHVFLSTSAISLYTTSTVVILGFLAGPVIVGYFNAANTIRNAAQGLLTPINQGIYPRINSLFDKNYTDAMKLIKKSTYFISGIAFLISIMLFVFSTPLVTYGLGAQYIDSINILNWMAFLPFIISLSGVFGIQVMLSHGYKKQFSVILIISGIINLIILYPLIQLWSGSGAAISMLITEIFVTLTMYMFIIKKKIYIFRKIS